MLKTSGTQPADAAVKAARAAADEAGDDAEPDPVEDPADHYNTLPTSNAADKKFKTCHAKAFAVRYHLRSSRRLSGIRLTCRSCFEC